MDLFVLVGQRKEAYAGQYAPEALAVIDEVGDSENPDYMREELAKQQKAGEFSALTVLHLRISDAAVSQALRPAASVLEAKVVA